MNFFTFIASIFLITSVVQADTVVFEKTQFKKSDDFSVDSVGYSIAFDPRAAIIVHISNWRSQPNYVERYDDLINVPGLSFDEKLGRRGAVIFISQDQPVPVICAYKTAFNFKDTGICFIDVTDDYQRYTVHLRVR